MPKWVFWKFLLLAELSAPRHEAEKQLLGDYRPKAADKHISPQSPQQLCSSNLPSLELELLLSAVPLQKEAGWDTSPLHIAHGSWHESDREREAISCVTHQALSPA